MDKQRKVFVLPFPVLLTLSENEMLNNFIPPDVFGDDVSNRLLIDKDAQDSTRSTTPTGTPRCNFVVLFILLMIVAHP